MSFVIALPEASLYVRIVTFGSFGDPATETYSRPLLLKESLMSVMSEGVLTHPPA
jgi:hypothetical protein